MPFYHVTTYQTDTTKTKTIYEVEANSEEDALETYYRGIIYNEEILDNEYESWTADIKIVG